MPISLLWKLAPVVLAFALCAAAFFAGQRYAETACEKARLEVILENEKKIQQEVARRHEVSLAYEEKLRDQKVIVKTVTNTIKTETEKPVYKDCVVPETGVKILNDYGKTLNDTRGVTIINETATTLNEKRKYVPKNPVKAKDE